jgi:hypothetical protein
MVGRRIFPSPWLMVSVVFDVAGFCWRNELGRPEFRAFGFYSLLIAAAAAPFAVLSGIALSKGRLKGSGTLLYNHLFIWPAFGLLVGLAVWRLMSGHDCGRSHDRSGLLGWRNDHQPMRDCMHDTTHRATFWPMAIATTLIGAIPVKMRTAVDKQAPKGYEDETGFHLGSPTFKN